MRIKLETSKRTGVPNDQQFDISPSDRQWEAEIPKRYHGMTQRTGISPIYNCHGLTFASRRARITDNAGIRAILEDDAWTEVRETKDVLPGDIVVYFAEDGDANHSGIVVANEAPLYVPVICSKWGSAGEYIHNINVGPTFWGPEKKFYRCRL